MGSSSSPYVKYRKWWRKRVKKNDDDDRGMIMTKAKQLFAVDDGVNSYRDGDTSATSDTMIDIPGQPREFHPLSCTFPSDLIWGIDRCNFYRPQFGTDNVYADSHGELFPLQS